MKQKKFFSHTSGNLGARVQQQQQQQKPLLTCLGYLALLQGVRSHGLSLFANFLVAVRHCLTFHPPTLLA